MTTPTYTKNTNAFFLQAAISFAIALGGMVAAEIYLPVSAWSRGCLALGTIFLVTSSFTLAKCVRDAQENVTVVSRLDQARLERMLAEFDPYQVPHLARAMAQGGPAYGPEQPEPPAGPSAGTPTGPLDLGAAPGPYYPQTA